MEVKQIFPRIPEFHLLLVPRTGVVCLRPSEVALAEARSLAGDDTCSTLDPVLASIVADGCRRSRHRPKGLASGHGARQEASEIVEQHDPPLSQRNSGLEKPRLQVRTPLPSHAIPAATPSGDSARISSTPRATRRAMPSSTCHGLATEPMRTAMLALVAADTVACEVLADRIAGRATVLESGGCNAPTWGAANPAAGNVRRSAADHCTPFITCRRAIGWTGAAITAGIGTTDTTCFADAWIVVRSSTIIAYRCTGPIAGCAITRGIMDLVCAECAARLGPPWPEKRHRTSGKYAEHHLKCLSARHGTRQHATDVIESVAPTHSSKPFKRDLTYDRHVVLIVAVTPSGANARISFRVCSRSGERGVSTPCFPRALTGG
jgi:hypothetical protein